MCHCMSLSIIFSDGNIDKIVFRFFFYYWINDQTLIGSELVNARYSEVKPVDYEGNMYKWPREPLATSFFSLTM